MAGRARFQSSHDAEFPVCWTEYYIHRDFAAVGRLLQRHTGPVFPLIEDLFGVSIARSIRKSPRR